MKTNEQYEAEIESKITTAKNALAVFESNIGKIGSVIGKDSTVVYNTLTSQINTTVEQYNLMIYRNSRTYQEIVNRLDNILMVLNEVMAAIDKIDRAPAEDQLTVKEQVDRTMEKVNEYAESLSTKIGQEITEHTGKTVGGDLIKYGLYGLGSYLILKKLIGLPAFISMAGAVGVVLVVDSKNK